MYKFIDLFSGIGGFHIGFEGIGECVYSCEWDEPARKTYSENFNTTEFDFDKDINDVDYKHIPDHDILTAGFPCQPFSIAGTQLGFEHETQGTLFLNILKILIKKKPPYFILENVKNFKSHNKGTTYNIIMKSLRDLNYYVTDDILNASEYGNLPQNRERIYIIGFLDKEKFDSFKFPDKIPLTKKLFDIIDITKKVDDKYYQTNLKSPSVQKMLEGVTEKGFIYQYRRYYIRKNTQGVCPTLTANMGTGGHNVPLLLDDYGVRKLTPRECFTLQGFPDDYILPNIADSQLYKQIGNAVPVPVVKRIIENITKL